MSRSISAPSSARALQSLSAPARLSMRDIAALSHAREERWRPGLTDQPLHSEIFATSNAAAGAGFALALAQDALRIGSINKTPLSEPEDRRQVLWVQDARAIKLSGRPYLHGLPRELRDRLIHVEAKTPEDVLFALEEGLRCRDLACVIGEVVGNPRALNFTASRRLSLTAERHGVALWLVRLDAEADLSSARMRWRVDAAPSALSRWNAAAPGTPAWTAELFRARSYAPGKWTLSDDEGRLHIRRPNAANTPDFVPLVRPTVGRSLAARARM